MSAPTDPPPPPDLHGVQELDVLLQEVARARRAQLEQRRSGFSAERLLDARRDTIRALERYTAALEDRCWPVPRRIHSELHLLKSLCAGRPGTAGGRP